jgi:class 3 adenylate cyclase
MDFIEVIDQVIDLLRQRGRLTYRTVKLQFNLDDEHLDALKEELLYSQPQVIDDDGKGLIWTGEAGTTLGAGVRHQPDAEIRLHALLPDIIARLQREKRVTYRTLKYVFAMDDTFLQEVRKELALRRLAIDEDSEVLVWKGETQPHVTEVAAPSNGPTAPPETRPIDAQQDEPVVTTESPRAAPEAERRQLTVMFCDLADSTKLSQQLDPEDLREVIRAYQQTSAEVIQRFDGYIAQHLGDGLMVYFGWPQAHEDDVQRALHSGLGIVEAIITTLNPRLQQEKKVQLTVRIGIHTGPVVVGEMGDGERQENLATGETVNIAARLEGLAAPNTVLISNATARLTRDAFELDDLGPQELKGIAEPINVFQVFGPQEVALDDAGNLPDGGVFLVGRDEEMGLLLRRWQQSKEGLGQVVLISGEAGIGKSSLVTTVRQQVRQEGCICMTFRSSPYYTNSALHPVIEYIQRILQFQPGDTPATRLDKLERGLGGYSRSLEEVVPLFADLLSMPLPEGRYVVLNVSPQQQRQQTQDVVVGWLLEEAERQPMLAMWEDLHWADPSTLELLGLVLEQTPTVPMLHVLTFRPAFTPPWPTRSHMTPIVLNRLERQQAQAFIMHLADGKALPAEVLEHIVAKTDGVPLYVEELTKMLLSSELLHEEADHYTLTGHS